MPASPERFLIRAAVGLAIVATLIRVADRLEASLVESRAGAPAATAVTMALSSR
jgi:hypothetical protein